MCDRFQELPLCINLYRRQKDLACRSHNRRWRLANDAKVGQHNRDVGGVGLVLVAQPLAAPFTCRAAFSSGLTLKLVSLTRKIVR